MRCRHLVLVCAYVLLATPFAWGQAAGTASSGSVWGKVTDETGSVLPGATVTIQGATLMGTQTAVTNQQGVYRFPGLPPGDYKVTFSLGGFNTLVREGIHITLAFTATVDVQLKLSSVAETVQVVGQSPVVDSVNTRVQTSFSKEVLASLPSARDMWSILAETPAVQMSRIDVGGSSAGTQTGYVAYGINGQTKPVVEGIIGLESNNSVGFYYDYGSFDEVNISAAGQGAEMATPGVQSIFISKSGGNQFHGDFYTDYENHNLQGTNISTAMATRWNLKTDSNKVWVNRDLNLSAGGHVVKDKFWWFGSFRHQDIEFNYPTLPPATPIFITTISDFTGKATYQLPHNNKLVAYIMWGLKKQPYRHDSATLGNTAFQSSLDTTWNQWNPGWVWKVEWNKNFGNNMFAEARLGQWYDDWHQSSYTDTQRREDSGLNTVYGGNRNWLAHQNRPQITGAVTYYKDTRAGSHNFKLGSEIQLDQRTEYWNDAYPGNVVALLNNGKASSVRLYASGLKSDSRLYWDSLFFTDAWTMKKVSLNLGVRWDHYRHNYPDQYRPASRFFDTMSVQGQDLLTWNELAPRIGVSWNMTGNAHNVLKASYGRYYWNPTRDVSGALNPNQVPQYQEYAWTDKNGNGLWDPGEQGQLQRTVGGVATQVLDPTLKGPYTDQVTTWYERQIAEKFGLRAGFVYNHNSRRYQNRNTLTPPSAYTIPIQVQDPGPDGVLGNADDGSLLNLLNLTTSLIGQTLNSTVNVPGYTESAPSVEIAANRRFSNRWSLSASWAATWRNDFNGIPYNPNGAQQSGYLRMTFVKISGSYEPGFGIRLSPLLRYQSGTPFGRTFIAKMNYGSQTVLVEPTGTERMDAPLIVDMRGERQFRLRPSTAATVFVDLFNIFNSNAAPVVTTSSGANFLKPTTILPPRVVRFGVKLGW